MAINLDCPSGATPLDADEPASTTTVRRQYIAALQAADARDVAPLLAFSRN